ncbi:MAG: hypothetical protein U0836_20720 [Pirellulales bacterium]
MAQQTSPLLLLVIVAFLAIRFGLIVVKFARWSPTREQIIAALARFSALALAVLGVLFYVDGTFWGRLIGVALMLAAAACVLVAAGQDVAARFPPEGEDRQERG